MATTSQTTVWEDTPPPKETSSLAMVLGFITEFNANVQIFDLTTLLLLLGAIAQMQEIQRIAQVHDGQLKGLQASLNQLRDKVQSLSEREDPLYRPSESNLAYVGQPARTKD